MNLQSCDCIPQEIQEFVKWCESENEMPLAIKETIIEPTTVFSSTTDLMEEIARLYDLDQVNGVGLVLEIWLVQGGEGGYKFRTKLFSVTEKTQLSKSLPS